MSMQSPPNEIGHMSFKRMLVSSLVLAVVIELITAALRFGLGLESTQDTRFLAQWTLGWRIHHGYIGVIGLLLSWLVPAGRWRTVLLIISIALVVSDFIHHFLVLWLLTGSPEFHLRYFGS